MTIRVATLDDLGAVEACAARSYAPYVPRMGREPAPMVADFRGRIEDGTLYVLETDGAVAGFAVLYPRGDHIHLENVAVFPERQGQGVGGRLIRFAEDEAGRRGLSAVELYTNIAMTENHTLYPALGYAETDRREEDGFTRVFYRKSL